MTNLGQPRRLTECKWLNLFRIDYVTAKGKEGRWIFASRKQQPRLGPAPMIPDAVMIVPLLKDGRTRQLVVIKEFRVPLGDYEYGFPAGLYDHNETAEEVARRELNEETGLKMTKLLYVGPPAASSAGLSDEAVVYVVCECTGQISNAGNEATEDITVELLDLEGVKALRNSLHKISAKALPFLLMFEGMGKVAWPKHMTR
ncbi:MAG TPA: NUDIX hydrolase [Pirellulales bacterium]|jgi:ADP-ribose pyrophosphatase|nr:NUDIX hydrolase [Pirellulales bacterium]